MLANEQPSAWILHPSVEKKNVLTNVGKWVWVVTKTSPEIDELVILIINQLDLKVTISLKSPFQFKDASHHRWTYTCFPCTEHISDTRHKVCAPGLRAAGYKRREELIPTRYPQQSRGNTESSPPVFHKNVIYKIYSLLTAQQCLSHDLSKQLLITRAKSDRSYFYTRMTAWV